MIFSNQSKNDTSLKKVAIQAAGTKRQNMAQKHRKICHRIQLVDLKVSEYPFKQNKNMLKTMTVVLHRNFYNISLIVLRPTFFIIYNLTFLRSPNIGKIRVKVEPKTDYFSYILSSCTNRIEVFKDFFSLICSQPRDKQNHACDFLLSKQFLNNLLLSVLFTLLKLIELLQ